MAKQCLTDYVGVDMIGLEKSCNVDVADVNNRMHFI